MNGKIKSIICVVLLSCYISISAFVPVLADDFAITSIPSDVENTDVAQQMEVAILGTIAQMLNNGANFDFSSFNGSYADFLNNVYNLSPKSMYEYAVSQLQSFGETVINGAETFAWTYNALTGKHTFDTLSQATLSGIQNAFNRQETTGQPQPDVDFSFLSGDIDFIPFTSGVMNNIPFIYSPYLVALQYSNIDTIHLLNTSTKSNYTYFNLSNSGSFNNSSFFFSTPLTIRITYDDNSATVTYENFNSVSIYYNTQNVTGIQIWQNNVVENQKYFRIYSNKTNTPNTSAQTSFAGLSTAINYIHTHFRHYNLYVNNVCWIDLNYGQPNFVYIDPNGMKFQDTEINVKVNYPEGTYFDYNTLKQIIQEIIDNKDVLTYNDIQNVFVDSNGQTAVAVYVVNQNPTDIDIDIQYPEGTPNFAQFEESFNMISNNTSPAIYLIELVAMVIPEQLWELLLFGGVLFLFVFLIKRMLE